MEKCKQRYIGESERNLKERMSEHIGYVKNNIITQATGEHFNLPGHDQTKMKFTIIEKVKKSDVLYRKEREHYHIKKFNTYYKVILNNRGLQDWVKFWCSEENQSCSGGYPELIHSVGGMHMLALIDGHHSVMYPQQGHIAVSKCLPFGLEPLA